MDTSLLIQAMNDLLRPNKFCDFMPNGLQISGKDETKTIVTGVSASLALIEAAIDYNADMILVHHGFFWQNESPTITDMKQKRIKTILAHNINLVGYHLPLDAHPTLGNNAQLAKRLGFSIDGTFDNQYVFHGHIPKPISVKQLASIIADELSRAPLIIDIGDKLIEKVVWCSGGAQKYIYEAALFGADAYLSGEISESTTHTAREMNVHYFACGHHATERYGVQALGAYLANEFELNHHFIDIDNPV